MIKKSVKILFFLVIIISFFILGLYRGEQGLFSIHEFKHVTFVSLDFIDIKGELAALDFNPAIKPRVVNIKCRLINQNIPICFWAEIDGLRKSAILETEIIESNSITRWDKDKILISQENSNYQRSIEINIQAESMTETYYYKDGKASRSSKLVGMSDKKLGSFSH